MTEVARVSPLKRQQPPEPLWRELLGRRLRALRAGRWETLADTAERAGISPQYLSEVERGLKEPSSEMIAALAGALGVTLAELLSGVTEELRLVQAVSDRASRLERASSLSGRAPLRGATATVALALAA